MGSGISYPISQDMIPMQDMHSWIQYSSVSRQLVEFVQPNFGKCILP